MLHTERNDESGVDVSRSVPVSPGGPLSIRSSFLSRLTGSLKTPIALFVILTVGVVVSGVIVYLHEREALLAEAESTLAAVVQLQAYGLAMWQEERMADAHVIASNRSLAGMAARFLTDPGDTRSRRGVQDLLDALKTSYDNEAVLLLDREGVPRLAAAGDSLVIGRGGLERVRQTRLLNRPMLFDFHVDSVRAPHIHLDLVIPLRLRDSAHAFLFMRIKPSRFIAPVLESGSAIHSLLTLSFLCLEKDLVAILRSVQGSSSVQAWDHVPLADSSLPEVRAVMGEKKLFAATAQDGEELYAYARPVKGTPWFIMASFRQTDVHSPLRQQVQLMVGFTSLFMLACAVAVVLLWSRDRRDSRRREAESTVRLQESRDRYRLLYEGMYQGVAYLDAGGRIIEVNPAARRILRISEGGPLDPPGADPHRPALREDGSVFPPGDHPSMVALRTGRPVLDVVMGFVHDGGMSPTWIMVNAIPLFPDGGTVATQVFTIFEDITDRRAVIERLRESEFLNRNLVEHLPLRIFIKDRSSRYLACNAAYAKDLGLTPEQLLGRTDFDVHPRDLAEQYRRDDAEVMGSNRRLDREELFSPGRDARWIRTIKVPYHDHHGALAGVLGFFEDITEQRREKFTEAARLRLLEFAQNHTTGQLLQQTLDEVGLLTDSPIGFYHYLEADQKTLSLQAWSTRTLNEFCQAEGKGRHYDLDEAGVWIDCVRQRRPVIHNDYASLPHRKGLPPGHAHVVRELAVPIFRGDLIVAILGVGNKPTEYGEQDVQTVARLADLAWDIVEIKRAEDRVRTSLREKDVLLKEVHHRVKNNLQVISSLLNLQAQGITDARAREAFFSSQTRVRSMALIHEKLYRSENFAGINFGDYLRSVTGELVRSYGMGHVTVEVDAASVHLALDSALPCGLIVNELVSNALKHAFEPGAAGSIRVTLQRTGAEELELVVADSGRGIPASFDLAKPSSMGMTLVTSLTDQLGGTISVGISGGTVFTVRFPG